jgi:hypothetical protein
MNNIYDFDRNDYDLAEKDTISNSISEPYSYVDNFNIEDYRQPKSEEEQEAARIEKNYEKDLSYQKIKVPLVTKSEYDKMSISERKKYAEDLDRDLRYRQSTARFKGALSEASLGFSESYDELKLTGEPGEFGGTVLGGLVSVGIGAKALSYPFRILQGLTKFGNAGQAALRIAHGVALGSGLETAKQTINGRGENDEYDSLKIAERGAEFGLFNALFEIPQFYRWVKGLLPGQKAQLLAENTIPKNLEPNQYKFYQDEIVPELQNAAKQEYESAYAKAIEENNLDYQQKLANTKAAHEMELQNISKEEANAAQEFEASKAEFENKMKQVQAEYEFNEKQIQQENELAIKEFEQQNQDFENLKKTQNVVDNAIKNAEISEANLEGRVTEGGNEIPFKPETPVRESPLENTVGNSISPQRIKNTRDAGNKNIAAIKAQANQEYKQSQELYNKSDQLNENIVSEQPNLVNDLRAIIEDLEGQSNLAAPQQKKLSSARKTLNDIVEVNKEGEIVGFKPVNNLRLLNEAKDLRQLMSYSFGESNAYGQLNPLVSVLQDAAEQAALSSGNTAAAEANQAARTFYRQWAKTYQTPLMRKYRNTNNLNPTKTFESSLNVDDFIQVDNVLSRTNAGQQLSMQTKRELVQKELGKFLKDPRKYNPSEFNSALENLEPVLSPQEIRNIKTEFLESRKTLGLKAEKINVKETNAPKLKESPEKTRIPTFKGKPKEVKKPETVNIPLKKPVTASPAMREAAHRMNITPEEALKKSNTVSGLKQMKKDLSSKSYKKVEDYKIKDIFYEGEVNRKFTGNEFYRILNKGDNYAIISEILGDEVTAELLEVSKKIADQKVTHDAVKKFGGKFVLIKSLHGFGLL